MANVCSGTTFLWATEHEESTHSYHVPGRFHCLSICPSQAAEVAFADLQLRFRQAYDE